MIVDVHIKTVIFPSVIFPSIINVTLTLTEVSVLILPFTVAPRTILTSTSSLIRQFLFYAQSLLLNYLSPLETFHVIAVTSLPYFALMSKGLRVHNLLIGEWVHEGKHKQNRILLLV